jgi:hypothetical protein
MGGFTRLTGFGSLTGRHCDITYIVLNFHEEIATLWSSGGCTVQLSLSADVTNPFLARKLLSPRRLLQTQFDEILLSLLFFPLRPLLSFLLLFLGPPLKLPYLILPQNLASYQINAVFGLKKRTSVNSLGAI